MVDVTSDGRPKQPGGGGWNEGEAINWIIAVTLWIAYCAIGRSITRESTGISRDRKHEESSLYIWLNRRYMHIYIYIYIRKCHLCLISCIIVASLGKRENCYTQHALLVRKLPRVAILTLTRIYVCAHVHHREIKISRPTMEFQCRLQPSSSRPIADRHIPWV